MEDFHGQLQNVYWILRHGLSKPNETGLIVSSPDNGVLPEHGLSEAGRRQAKLAVELLKAALIKAGIGLEAIAIYASPFSRTQETAAIAAEELGMTGEGPPMSLAVQEAFELRERYFGPEYELQSHEKYPEIWAMDAKDPRVGPTGGESVMDVAVRLQGFIKRAESQSKGKHILLVSHGDPLQILQACISGPSVKQYLFAEGFSDRAFLDALASHRTYALSTGEVRRLSTTLSN